MSTKTVKMRWSGPESRIPDLGVIAKPGDVLDMPAGTEESEYLKKVKSAPSAAKKEPKPATEVNE